MRDEWLTAGNGWFWLRRPDRWDSYAFHPRTRSHVVRKTKIILTKYDYMTYDIRVDGVLCGNQL